MIPTANWLERRLLILILISAGIGLAWSAPGRAAVNHHGITIALVILVAAVGLGLPTSAIAESRRYANRVALMIVAPSLVLPAIAYVASRLVQAGPLRLGVLAAGVAPSEVASIALAALAGGSVALSAAVLIGSTAVCVLFAGPVLHLMAGSAAGFSTTSLLLSLLGIVAVPLAVGAIVRTQLPHRALERADKVSSAAASLAVLVLIWLVASQAHLGVSYLRAGAALAVFLVGSTMLAGLLTVGLPSISRISLLLPVAMRDFAIAAGIATQAFGASASAALGLYGVLVLLFGAAVANVRTRTQPIPK